MSAKETTVPPPGVVHVTSLATNNNGVGAQKARTADEIAQPTRKRRSRFSDAPPAQHAPPPKVLQMMPPPPPPSSKASSEKTGPEPEKKSGLVSAVAAAARINANLLAQGKIKSLPNVSKNLELTSKSTAPTVSIASEESPPVISTEIKKVEDMFIAEVEINDIPLGCRNYLTRLTTQETINKTCTAYVSTRGKFMLPGAKRQNSLLMVPEKPLYLHVQSQNEDSVKKAVSRIKQIVGNHFAKKNQAVSDANQGFAPTTTAGLGFNQTVQQQGFASAYPLIQNSSMTSLPPCQPALPSGNYVQEKLFIGLDSVPEILDVKNKLIGPNYRNFTFIANQTGAKVILRGRGSGFIEPTSGREAYESMHAFISHPNQPGVDAARQLVQNLVDTVKAELAPYITPPTQSNTPQGFGQSSGVYESTMVTPPVPPPAPITAYPFQNQAVPMAYPTAPSDTATSYHDLYSTEDGILGYQHNFTGKKEESGEGSSKKARSKEKLKRKRFTEESPMPPPPLPSGKPKSSEVTSPEHKSSISDKEEASETGKGEQFKMPTMPFWMTP